MWLERLTYIVPLRWRSLVRRRDVDRDLDDEIADHLQSEIEAQVAGGADAAEARRRVLRDFGGVVQSKEACRDARGFAFYDALAQDVRYGARTLLRNPGFTIVSVLTLALGIGANTAVFSLVEGILLSPLPYPAPERLVAVTGTYPNGGIAEMRRTVRTMEVGSYAEGHSLTLTGAGDPVRLSTTRVSAELFGVLGTRPLLGRWLRAGEDVAGRDRFVILSHATWTTRFGADARIVGRSLVLDGVEREVVAVMPASFRFPSVRTEIWVPLSLDPGDVSRYWGGDYMPVVGRLRPGSSAGQAQSEIRLFQSGIGALFPWPMPASWNRDVGVIGLEESLVGSIRVRLLILMAAVVLVLVVACANVANLSLSRAVAREHEIGIRAAIGAGPRRIARQLLTESVLLASLGGVAGLVLATQALVVLKLVLPPETPRLGDVHLQWTVLGFTALVTLLAGCAFGLAPVAHAWRLRLRAAMEAGGRGTSRGGTWRLRAGLTIAQVACAVLLVITAGLLVRSLWTLTHVDPGFRLDDVMTAVVSPTEDVCSTPERCVVFYRGFENDVRTSTAIRGAGLVNTLPLTGAVAKRSIEVEGYTREAEAPLFWLHTVTPGYLDVLGIRVESGRAFTDADISLDAPVAVVSSATARRFWPGQSPLGRHVRFAGETGWRTIVGIVNDVHAYDLTRHVPAWIAGTLYVPHGLRATMEDGRIPANMTVVLRTSMSGPEAGTLLRHAAATAGAHVAISDVRPMRTVVADAVAAPAATTSLLVTMAAIALVLGCVGVYGVLSFLVSRQTRDLGIRIALGAARRDVFWLVIREGAALCLAGIALGAAGAVAMTRWLASELYGVSPTDPLTYAGVAVAVSLVTFVACYVPTRRAMGVDPLVVLRES